MPNIATPRPYPPSPQADGASVLASRAAGAASTLVQGTAATAQAGADGQKRRLNHFAEGSRREYHTQRCQP